MEARSKSVFTLNNSSSLLLQEESNMQMLGVFFVNPGATINLKSATLEIKERGKRKKNKERNNKTDLEIKRRIFV